MIDDCDLSMSPMSDSIRFIKMVSDRIIITHIIYIA